MAQTATSTDLIHYGISAWKTDLGHADRPIRLTITPFVGWEIVGDHKMNLTREEAETLIEKLTEALAE